ncbi:hypothetical protein ACLB2K_065714 [Fragaria x ananassa]
MADSSACKVVGIGSIKIRTHDGKFCTLNDVRHAPRMTKNLISLGLLDSKGFRYKGSCGVLNVYKGSNVVLKGVKRGTLYFLHGSTLSGSAAVASSEVHKDDMTKLWHMRLGHMSERGMQILSKHDLLGGHKVKDLGFCEHCIFGKLHRRKFPKAIHRTKGTLDYIHSDCWGLSRVDSLGDHRYFVSMIDDYSRMTWVYVMKHKSDAFKDFKQWKTLVENQTGEKIKRLRTDNGLEFCSTEFDEFCKTEGIARHHTIRNTPQQNGVAERMNQTLLERARCMLSNAGLERRFWAEAGYLFAVDSSLPFITPSPKPTAPPYRTPLIPNLLSRMDTRYSYANLLTDCSKVISGYLLAESLIGPGGFTLLVKWFKYVHFAVSSYAMVCYDIVSIKVLVICSRHMCRSD